VRTRVTELFGIEYPIFAFSHCRDVVAAVSRAGGMGVLGALYFTPEELETELAWIDEHAGGKPYGVDVVMPAKYEGAGLGDAGEMLDQLQGMIPPAHRTFVNDLLARHGVEPLTEEGAGRYLLGWTDATARPQVEVALKHPIALLASALGPPPADVVEEAHRHGVTVAGLASSARHARKQVDVGVDIIVAQGTEAGGHCGEVTTLVLIPEVIDAIQGAVPVLAAGGIVTGRQMAATVAMGADGAWTGSVWLTTEEAETAPHTVQKFLAASSRDTIRSTGRTGKPARQLVSDWTDAWQPHEGGHKTLPLPLQSMLAEPVIRRVDVLAAQGHPGAQALATYFVGQGVGLMNKVKPAREVVREFIEDYLSATERLSNSLPD
jgi:NAD(P)H-dependent flavin oxidoreductase YrpB (nitropropane dioxygenase family)